MLDVIRSAAAGVADAARWVQVDHHVLAEFAQRVPVDAVREPVRDPAQAPRDDPGDRAAFPLVMAAVNFGSGWFPVLRKRSGLSGSRTIMAALAEHSDRHGVPSADELVRADAAWCAALFEQDPDGPAGELMALFARSWNELGRLLLDDYDGSFLALVEDAGRSAERLVALLDRMPLFHDVWRYRGGLEVPLYKRAQLAAGDLSLAGFEFDDLHRLTMFADNLVPHVLRVEGVLRYEPDLLARIDREELLAAGSDEEIEIRAVAVHAVELLTDLLPVTAMQLDMWFWNEGRLPKYKAQPRHRTRTTAY